MVVAKAPSTAPRTNAGVREAMAAGTSHRAVLLSWRTRRASAAASTPSRRLLPLLDDYCGCSTAPSRRLQQSCSAVQLAVRPYYGPQRSPGVSSGFEVYRKARNSSASHK